MASPILALDLDGVVVNLTPEIFRRLTKADYPLPIWEQPPTFRWTTAGSGLPEKAINYVIGLYSDPDLYAQAQPVEGAIEGIRTLREQGWLVMAVTSRKAIAAGVTHAWLEEYGIKNMPVLLTNDKAKLAKQYGFAVAIDDAPHHLEDYQKMGVTALVYDTPYNRDITGLIRVRNWREIVTYLHKTITRRGLSGRFNHHYAAV